MPELTGDAAAKNVGQTPMTVCRHRDEIALLADCASGDFLCWITACENGFCLEAFLLQGIGDAFDVLAVALHLLRLAELELIDVSRRPAIRHMNEHDRRVVAGPRQLSNVRENNLVVRRILDRHQYALIHQLTALPKNWTSSQMLSAAITSATAYASAFIHTGLTNCPIFALSDVNRTSGKTAKDSCMLRTT